MKRAPGAAAPLTDVETAPAILLSIEHAAAAVRRGSTAKASAALVDRLRRASRFATG